MMLWDIIRDFFVSFVFGGYTSNGDMYMPKIGHIWISSSSGNIEYNFDATMVGVPIGNNINAITGEVTPTYITFGDWLSTTATIITIVALFIGISMFIIKLVKWISNAIALR